MSNSKPKLPFPEAKNSDFWCLTDGDQSSSGHETKWSKFVWKIKNFSDRPEQKGEFVRSKVFRVVGESDTVTKWELQVFPKGQKGSEADSFTVRLANCSEVKVKVNCNLSFIINGKELNFFSRIGSIKPNLPWGAAQFRYLKNGEWAHGHADLMIQCKISVMEIDNNLNKMNRDQMTLDLAKAFKSKNSNAFDVKVKCGDASFECSKFMLTSMSPVFRSMFEANMIESQTNVIEIVDLQPEVLAEMLQYIHTGLIPNVRNFPQDLLVAADRYQLERLKSSCQEILIDSLDVENCISFLTLSDIYNALNLRRAALKYVTKNMTSISSSCDWRKELSGFPSLMADMIETLTTMNDSLKKQSD